MQLSYGSTMLVNGKWEMVNGKAASDWPGQQPVAPRLLAVCA